MARQRNVATKFQAAESTEKNSHCLLLASLVLLITDFRSTLAFSLRRCKSGINSRSEGENACVDLKYDLKFQ